MRVGDAGDLRTGHMETAGGPYVCPECLVEYETPEDLGPHLERHRPAFGPVWTKNKYRCEKCAGKGVVGANCGVVPCTACKGRGSAKLVTSLKCRKGCDRHFIERRERIEHEVMCDGSAPLAPERPVVLAERTRRIRVG